MSEIVAKIATKCWAEKLSLDKLKELHEKYKQALNCDHEALLRIAVNLIAMFGHLNADVMTMRQESIKPALRPEFQKICHASILPNSEFLFGDDLAKLVRDSKETNHIANTSTKAPRNGTSNTNRRSATTYSRFQ